MSDDTWFMASPCKHCPFRRDVRPFLHPERAADIAESSCNPYSDFTCHKTLDHDEEGDTIEGADSLTCAGFLAMQVANGKRPVEGFTPSPLVYSDHYEMADAYQEAWDERASA